MCSFHLMFLVCFSWFLHFTLFFLSCILLASSFMKEVMGATVSAALFENVHFLYS